MDNEININADFITFRNQIVEKFGEQYFEQAELFFERAVAQAEKGLLLSAISDGKFAIELSNYSKDKTGLTDIIGFISQLHCDLGQISKSKAYYELGLKLLDPESEYYETDKESYRKLKKHIDSENWKGSIEDDKDE